MIRKRGNDFLCLYQTALEDDNLSYIDVGRIIDEYRPSRLYRYMSFNEHWRKNIFEGQVYLSTAKKLNDPFDCLIHIDRSAYINFMTQKTNELFPFLNKCVLGEVVTKVIEDDFDKELEKIRSKFLVACFTECMDSALMWAHYADSHKGFCIEYDLSKLPTGYRYGLFPVIYSDKRYDATSAYIEKRKNLLLNPMLYKSVCWAYENEWRMVVPEGADETGENYADFKSAISGIYLGLKSGENYKLENEEICAKCAEENIPVYQMYIESRGYDMKSKILVHDTLKK